MYMQHILQNGFSFRKIGGIQFVDTTTKYFQIWYFYINTAQNKDIVTSKRINCLKIKDSSFG